MIVEGEDQFLFGLALQPDGREPDTASRCRHAPTMHCMTAEDCPLFLFCSSSGGCVPTQDFCDPGGTDILATIPLTTATAFGGVPLGPLGYYAYQSFEDFMSSPDRGTFAYTPGNDLWSHAYDWRRDLDDEVEDLRRELATPRSPEVGAWDIVAHSMGGLLVRAYLAKYETDSRIRNVIYLGTPHAGAPKAWGSILGYTNFLGGAPGWFFNTATQAAVVSNMPGVYELLPRSPFVRDTSGNLQDLATTFSELPNQALVDVAAAFFDQLPMASPISGSFAIDGTGKATIESFDNTSAHCTRLGTDPAGDGTVPYVSATALGGTHYFFVNEEHSALPGNAHVQQQIVNILQGTPGTLAAGISRTPSSASWWSWFTCSPVRVTIADIQGATNGLDTNGRLRQGIPDSSHFAFSEHEAGLLPYDAVYQFSLRGTGSGTATLEIQTVRGNDDVQSGLRYMGIPVTPSMMGYLTLAPGEAPTLDVDLDGDGTADTSVTPTIVPGCRSEADCDDGDPCTTDFCDGRTCSHRNDSPACLPRTTTTTPTMTTMTTIPLNCTQLAEQDCGCDHAQNHRDYVRCVKHLIKSKSLATQCLSTAKQCAAQSTCGRGGAVTCYRTTRKGVTHCSVRKTATSCKPPRGGRASVGAGSSCCDTAP